MRIHKTESKRKRKLIILAMEVCPIRSTEFPRRLAKELVIQFPKYVIITSIYNCCQKLRSSQKNFNSSDKCYFTR